MESGCSAGERSKKCKGVFMEECSKQRPAWTHNLTCTKCVEEVEAELRKKKGFDCSEEEKVFIKDKCGTKGSCKERGIDGSHPATTSLLATSASKQMLPW